MDIQQLRKQIDEVDAQIVSLFCQRMDIASQIGAYKKEHCLPVYVPSREAEKLQEVTQLAGPEMEEYIQKLYHVIFELSRSHQGTQEVDL